MKPNIIYEPYKTLEEQEAAEKRIQEDMERSNAENQKLLAAVTEETQIEEEAMKHVKSKFKLYRPSM